MDTPSEGQKSLIDADQVYITAPVGYAGNKGGPKVRIMEWLKIRAMEPTISMVEIARRLNVNPRTLYRDVAGAVKEGWLRLEDPMERIDYQIIPKTLDNLKYFLDQGDKTVTIETAKATIFKTYLEHKGVNSNNQTTVLALKLELPEGEKTAIVAGKIVGQGRVLEAENE
mgnify:CR=1 FL=1